MFTVAGAPFTPMWRWRCPERNCKTALIKENATALLEAAVRHYQALHGPLEGQGELEFERQPGPSRRFYLVDPPPPVPDR